MMACRNAELCHVNSIVLDNGHRGYSRVILIFIPQLRAVAVVYLYYDREYSWDDCLKKVAAPLLQCFSHNRVVGICKHPCNGIPSLIPAVAAVVKKYSHQLRDSQRGVSVVYLDSYLVGKIIQRAIGRHVVVDYVSDGSRTHKVLLPESE